jgi:hypothetical protein
MKNLILVLLAFCFFTSFLYPQPVSWQVTGIRHDKFAEKNRIPVEENKRPEDIGKYLHPDAYGVSETLGADYEHNQVDRKKK